MCGIIGYVGKKSAVPAVLEGLKALEYRGYDSAGITALTHKGPVTIKQVGRVEALEAALKESSVEKTGTAIGHTRWATHGSPSITNAHPHHNTDETIFVAHNGIIENYQELRAMLKAQGYTFATQTDTEVIPQLIDFHLRTEPNFFKAFQAAVKDLVGAYAIAALYTKTPGHIYAARLSSPLVIGVGKDEHFLASDPSAVMEHTKRILYLDDYEVAEITAEKASIHNIKKAISVERNPEVLDYDQEKAVLGDFPHFMIKEIYEGPQTIQAASRGRLKPELNTIKLGGLESVSQQLQHIDRIIIVACGTAYYAGMIGEYLIEEIAGIPVEVQLSSEFKYRQEPLSRSTALIAISQSGETADTIAALKKVEEYGILRLGIVNAVGSTITRITDAGVYCHAGIEQSVASTKAFMAQVTVLAEIALYLSQGKTPLFKPLLDELTALPGKAKQILEEAEHIKKLSRKYKDSRSMLYLGRNYLFPCALEGALKLKETSYIHAEGMAAGELKHGPLAMIDESLPSFVLATKSKLLEKTISNMEEIKARGGPMIAVATKGNTSVKNLADDVIYIPDTMEELQPLLVVIVLQLFAYYIAVEKGLNVDRPRNLAKSVTVE
jgi:glucosamine--fructose-6-phosphate aminotransferase (isomerizing)